jgi:hypothetical protein
MVAIQDPCLLRWSYRLAKRPHGASLSSRFVSGSVVEEPVALSASNRCLPPLDYEPCVRALAPLTRRPRHEGSGCLDRYGCTLNAVHREVLCVVCASVSHDRSSVYPFRVVRSAFSKVKQERFDRAYLIGASPNTSTPRSGTGRGCSPPRIAHRPDSRLCLQIACARNDVDRCLQVSSASLKGGAGPSDFRFCSVIGSEHARELAVLHAEFPDGFSSTAAGVPDRHFGDARDSFQFERPL